MDRWLAMNPVAHPRSALPLPAPAVSPPLVPEIMGGLGFCSSLARTGAAEFSGYIYDSSDLSRRLVVQIVVFFLVGKLVPRFSQAIRDGHVAGAAFLAALAVAVGVLNAASMTI